MRGGTQGELGRRTTIAVTQVAETKRDRISRRQVDKFAERRAQLAGAALVTLAELGYARTSLREIAQNSEFSHGVLHYYFTDKADLITQCVRQYNEYCVTRYDQVVATSQTAHELKRDFAAGLAKTLVDDTAMHRLWYDLRTQSLFEQSFQADVAQIDQSLERMIWRIVTQFAELAGSPLAVSSEVAYAIFDGLFQQALLKHLSGNTQAASDLRAHVTDLMGKLLVVDSAA
jgi:AcrR family transcriptional regulator